MQDIHHNEESIEPGLTPTLHLKIAALSKLQAAV
jgi:hypothetical protein